MTKQAIALQPPNPNILIRPVAPQDIHALLENCWTDRTRDSGDWLISRAMRHQRMGRGLSVVVYLDDGTIIGYGQVTLWPRCAEISDLVIATGYRSQGYGTALIQYLVRVAFDLGAKCIEIGAAESNIRAIDLYHRLGFVDQRVIEMSLGQDQREPVIYMELPMDA